MSLVGNVFISGPPASGKGTLCEQLNERYGLVHISAGDLLRTRRRFMPELADYLDNGKLVPDEIVCAVISERLAQEVSAPILPPQRKNISIIIFGVCWKSRTASAQGSSSTASRGQWPRQKCWAKWG